MKKKEVKLIQKVVGLDEFKQLNSNGIYPLVIVLNSNEIEMFESKINDSNEALISSIKDFYEKSVYSDKTGINYLMLNSYALRRKIECNDIYVSQYIDAHNKTRYVDCVVPSCGYDLDAPKIILRSLPRFLFRTMDHFSLDRERYYANIDSKNEVEVMGVCFDEIMKHQKQRKIAK